MRVIVTRPLREALQWCAQFDKRGLETACWPLIEVRAASQPAAVQAAWWSLVDMDAALFVSANAVDYFWQQKPALPLVPLENNAIKTVAFAPGPGTAQALLAHGAARSQVFTPAANAVQFDSESLWQVVQPMVGAGFRLLVVRGTTAGATHDTGVGRDWFAQQVLSRGGTVQHVVVYERACPVWEGAQRAQASAAAADGSVWLFSSSEAITYLGRLLPGHSWQSARCICTHPRIAQAARKAGFGVVCESRPSLDAVAGSIESLG